MRFENFRAIVVPAMLLTMWSFTAAAHDVSAPISGEQVPPRLYERLIEKLSPAAKAAATISLEGALRVIRANGYPEHMPGSFPNKGNPHRIQRKNYRLTVSANPQKGDPKPLDRTPFGITINGVLMDPATAEFWRNERGSSWNYEAFGGACQLGVDQHNAHVQPNGTYHYHGIPTGLLERFDYKHQPALLGFAADGFPVYGPWGYKKADDPESGMKELSPGYRLRDGTRPNGPGGPGGAYDGKFTADYVYQAGLGDLDECNGRDGVTAEYPNGTYYYVLSQAFPHIPRCLRGQPSESFRRLKGGGGGNGSATRPPRHLDNMDNPPRAGMHDGPPPVGPDRRRSPGSGPCRL